MPNRESNKQFYLELTELIDEYEITVDKSLIADDSIEYNLRKFKLESFKY